MALADIARANGGGYFELDPAEADIGIQAAIDSLGTTGGVVDIYPASGGATYQLKAAILSTKPNVTIRGNNSLIGFSSSPVSLYGFRVRGPNWTFDGCRFTDTAAAGLGTNTRRIISIEDNGTDGASAVTRIVNCYFDVTLATQEMRDYQCISVVGNSSSSAAMRHGLYVAGCSFVAGVNSMPNTRYATGTTPNGITFIKTDKSGAQRIVGNDFRGQVGSSTLADDTGPLDTVQVNATVASGTSMVWKSSTGTLTGTIQPGSTFVVAGDATTYTVVKQATASSNTVNITFWPTLAVQADANDAVTVTATTAYGHIASAITLIDHNQSLVQGNTFKLLSTQAAEDGEGHVLIYSRVGTGESGHSSIRGNEFEDIDSWYVVRVEGSAGVFDNAWTHTTFNNFGRIIPRCEAVVSYSQAARAHVVGNHFHNVGGGSHGSVDTNGYPIDLTNCTSIALGLNAGSIMDTTESIEWHDGGGNRNIQTLAGNLPEWDF